MRLIKLIFIVGVAFFIGNTYNKAKSQREALQKVGEYHRICLSQLEEKIEGNPCSMCKVKWRDNQEESPYGKYVEYQLKRWGKTMKELTTEELKEIQDTLIQMYIDIEPNGREIYENFKSNNG